MRIVLPSSQRTYRMHWGSHKDLAAKALKKLAGPHVPASLNALERAVERVHADHRAALEALADASSDGSCVDGDGVMPDSDDDMPAETDADTDHVSEGTAED